MLDSLDLGSVQAWARAAAESLEQRRDEIDALNVFPIADADTGTNLAVTMRAAGDALTAAVADRSAGDAATALRALARGAATSARGNSGVIMAQLLRGLADGVADAPSCDATQLRAALAQAATSAYAAVGAPVEGTILSVARAAATGARNLPAAAVLADVVRSARDSALTALARTPNELAVLADAGVVDAGGRGLLVVLDALCGVVTGDLSVLGAVIERPASVQSCAVDDSQYGYEVQYLLDAPTAAMAALRTTLTDLGDSLTVAEIDDASWNVHVHVDDVGAAIEAGVAAGRPHQIRVTRFADQVSGSAGSGPSIVVLLGNRGLSDVFEGAGAQVVVVEGEDAAAVRAMVRTTRGARCVLLPVDERLVGLASTVAVAARAEGVDVAVVPCRSPMQGLAAVAVHDPTLRAEDDVIAMAEAAAATRYARIEVAEGAGLTTIGACQAGDVLGLIDDEVVEIGRDIPAITQAVLDRLLGIGGELITAVISAAATEIESVIRERVAARAPFAELTVYADEQLDCLALLALE